jgi:NAD(P)-dependent dehydrogenase (short-subunit alcohol dehydrogenase family)
VDVLVNNAGFVLQGPFAEAEVEATLDEIRVNVLALTALTRLFLPGMRERGQGHVLNVASTAAYFPGPFMAVYYASKAYVLSFSEGLANELRGTGVKVTAPCPPATATGLRVPGRRVRLPAVPRRRDGRRPGGGRRLSRDAAGPHGGHAGCVRAAADVLVALCATRPAGERRPRPPRPGLIPPPLAGEVAAPAAGGGDAPGGSTSSCARL